MPTLHDLLQGAEEGRRRLEDALGRFTVSSRLQDLLQQIEDSTTPLNAVIEEHQRQWKDVEALLGRCQKQWQDATAPLQRQLATFEEVSAFRATSDSIAKLLDGVSAVNLERRSLNPAAFLPDLSDLPSAEDTMRRVVREEVERALAKRDAAPPDDEDPLYGSDGVKRTPGFRRE